METLADRHQRSEHPEEEEEKQEKQEGGEQYLSGFQGRVSQSADDYNPV
jgi:hypothetical protein